MRRSGGSTPFSCKQWRGRTGTGAGLRPSNFLAGGVRKYLSPRNSRNRNLLTPADTMSQLTRRTYLMLARSNLIYVCCYFVTSATIFLSPLPQPSIFLNGKCGICADQLPLETGVQFFLVQGYRRCLRYTQIDWLPCSSLHLPQEDAATGN